MTTLSQAFAPALHGQPAESIVLSGPSGVGKTALARYTLSRLEEFVSVPHAYIPCLGNTSAELLRIALRDLPQRVDVNSRAPFEELKWQYRDVVSRPTILIFDEADDLPDHESDTLRTLFSLPQTSTVVITHDGTEWLANVPAAVRQTFGEPDTVTRYSTAELADILETRAVHGFAGDVITRDQLERIADESAGVARRGIQSLYAAAQLAQERQHGRIADQDVDDSFARARHRIRRMNLSSLPFHHHVLYALLCWLGGEASGDDLQATYDDFAEGIYRDRAPTPISRRSRRTKLQKLAAYDLVEQVGKTRARRYRVVDPDVTTDRVDIREYVTR